MDQPTSRGHVHENGEGQAGSTTGQERARGWNSGQGAARGSRERRGWSGGGGRGARLALGFAGLAALLLTAGCRVRRNPPRERPTTERYAPRTRRVTITTVPLLTREMQKVYPFLKQDFAAGGVLEGKEVYAFSPASVTAVVGDTLRLTLVNPEDDKHSFVLPDFYVPLPPQSRVDTAYVARSPGVFPFTCNVPAHLPFMWGQLVVLSPDAVSAPGGTFLLGR